ncbi:MAG: ATP-binding cassette domain-containing protein, partial [Candidatus Thorarchaeota archaeon]
MYAVELENINKTFPGDVQANKDITLRIEKGEVHGLLGENGAGKSTLMNILYGLLRPDSGRIVINGETVDLYSPHDAIVRGVGMVHQHFKLIPPLTVTENVVLGLEPKSNRPTRAGLGTMIILSAFAVMLMSLFLPLDLALIGTAVFLVTVAILYFL